jgi:crossover junction endodeoxyribonuclease RuvC
VNVLGLDPGAVSAAYASISDEAGVIVGDVPVANRNVDPWTFTRILQESPKVDMCVLEQVHAFPGQAASSSFRFGQGYGTLLGVTAALGYPVTLVSPQRWKKYFGLDANKEKSRALAIRLFPKVVGLERARDHDRAEALLIAHWYMKNYN